MKHDPSSTKLPEKATTYESEASQGSVAKLIKQCHEISYAILHSEFNISTLLINKLFMILEQAFFDMKDENFSSAQRHPPSDAKTKLLNTARISEQCYLRFRTVLVHHKTGLSALDYTYFKFKKGVCHLFCFIYQNCSNQCY